ncbi:MAG: SIS domain-containing protein [Chloroflexi bacterium AL-W]|nr:SIS domain-containing protein [Chloroflexi bacterium AL-N1]NOK65293.1 SIS domain-containing protein [Chloroflexi bacterium AL-N10]NOK72442.1 SIS domain-containing protein [Chloroflexi bacterium AL-N5]NOK79472.1 SIS domain-containing protein [Chloroflexi bacterium AL-W]NOK87388.1 SIS domain-containing protein [Chloroflexi bacterium AL-N15]
MRTEITEQPAILHDLLAQHMPVVQEVAQAIRRHNPDYVFLAARGTSRHAGTYAQYLWGAFNQLSVALASPSLFTQYERPPRLDRALVIGISQSGQSPDIVRVIEVGQRQGSLTLAITNDVNSPLAHASAHVLDTSAGVEMAVAATKTYTAQLMVLAMLSVALNGCVPEQMEALSHVPGLVQQVLAREAELADIAQRYTAMERCIVLGRGYNYASALEWALKLKELTTVAADPYSSAEFQHGPIALASQGTPVFAIVPRDVVSAELETLLHKLVHSQQVRLFTLSDEHHINILAHDSFQLPEGMAPWVSPIVGIVAAQLFCYHLTLAKGCDPMSPPGLHKVTLTY